MRQCLELGLHRQRAIHDDQIKTDQHRKRLFWSVYIVERKTALVLGRPFGVSDKEIEADIPLDVGDDENDQEILVTAQTAQTSGERLNRRNSVLCLHRHHILLYHIHTRIRFTLHHLRQAHIDGSLHVKLEKRFRQLEEWKENVLREYTVMNSSAPTENNTQSSDDDSGNEKPIPFRRSIDIERTELLLEYHKARRSLLQPLLTEARTQRTPSILDYEACADASGQICQLYRRLHRLSTTPFTLRDLHAIFVAGFTLIYCICARPDLYDTRRAGDVGACSTALYVISEQWPSARKYRDAFEVVAEKMVECTRKARESTPSRRQGIRSLESSRSHSHDSNARDISSVQSKPLISNDHDRALSNDLQSHSNGLVVASQDSSQVDSTGENHTQQSVLPNNDASSFTDPGASNLDAPGLCLPFDFESDFDDIGGLLTNEGMDWFADAVFE